MKIGILGSGNVGGVLGKGWAAAGHKVCFASRRPQELGALLSAAPGSTAATPSETAAACPVLALATPWPITRTYLEGLGDLTGKILLDATNPLLPDLSGLEVGTTSSGGEMVARWAPGAKVVKIFNTIGSSIMENPVFGEERALLLYCGDDAEALEVARQLGQDLGFQTAEAGGLRAARILEPFGLLWISLAFGKGYGREFAFSLVRR